MKNILGSIHSFAAEEDGIAMTEYLILLGLLAGGAIASVLAIGTELGASWLSWETWFEDPANDLGAPT